MTHVVLGLLLIALGLSALLGTLALKIIFALLLIFAGIKLLTSPRQHHTHKVREIRNEDTINETIVFSALNRAIKSEHFDGGTLTIVMGGGMLNLTEVITTAPTITLDCTCIFGGLKLFVPRGWTVKCQTTAIFGGCENRTEPGTGTTLIIKGTVCFGGIEIVH